MLPESTLLAQQLWDSNSNRTHSSLIPIIKYRFDWSNPIGSKENKNQLIQSGEMNLLLDFSAILVPALAVFVSVPCLSIGYPGYFHIWSSRQHTFSPSGTTLFIPLTRNITFFTKGGAGLSSNKLINCWYNCLCDLEGSMLESSSTLSSYCLLEVYQHICILNAQTADYMILLGQPSQLLQCAPGMSELMWKYLPWKSVAVAEVFARAFYSPWHTSLNGSDVASSLCTWKRCDVHLLQSQNNGTCFQPFPYCNQPLRHRVSELLRRKIKGSKTYFFGCICCPVFILRRCRDLSTDYVEMRSCSTMSTFLSVSVW